MENKILVTYKKQGDSDVLITSQRVTGKLENNSNFTNLPAAHADLKKLLPDFQTSVVNAKGREKELIAIKNSNKAKLVALLTELADYVTIACNGDRAKLLSSGFDITGDRSNKREPFIEKLLVELGPPGEVTIRIKRVPGARGYMHQYCTEQPTSNTIWVSEGSSFGSYTFNRLNSATKYWFRVIAIGTAGTIVASPVESCIVQ